MIKLKNILEKHGETYDYSSAQFDITGMLAEKIISWGKSNISDDSVSTNGDGEGREDEIHFTVLYGIEEELPKKTFKLLKKVKPFYVELDIIDRFTDNDDFDVIKINVKGKYLTKLHYYLEKNLDNANTYKDYIPHITIAYVKKFSNADLVGDTTFQSRKIYVDRINFSSKNGKDYNYKL